MAALNPFEADVVFASERYAQFAIQGPKALATLQKMTHYRWRRSSIITSPMARFRVRRLGSRGQAIPAKTGLRSTSRRTKRSASGTKCWKRARSSVSSRAGLGARNTLRLEVEDGALRA